MRVGLCFVVNVLPQISLPQQFPPVLGVIDVQAVCWGPLVKVQWYGPILYASVVIMILVQRRFWCVVGIA